jgi:hypothetical protein
MTPTRIGAVIGGVIVALPILWLAPVLFAYVGTAFAYHAGAIGEWARLPAAVTACLVLFLAAVAVGATVGRLASKP